RGNFADSIVYQVETTTDYRYYYNNVLSSSLFNKSVVKSVIKRDSLFDLLPNEPYILNDELCINSMRKDSFITKNNTQRIPFNKTINCWSYQLDYPSDVCNFGYSFFYKGLGGPYYKFESGCWTIDTSTEENTLVYYKKGSKTWGTPLVISGIDLPEVKPDIAVYPNPATDKISISSDFLSEPCIFEMMDVRGIVILRTEVDAIRNSVNLSGFSKGLYLFRLLDKVKLLKTGKIVKY
ncbi:MAG: T9SS type A sorting domain-containing protein, partial [Paludibacter sp.]